MCRHPALDERILELFSASLSSLKFDHDIGAAIAHAKRALRELEAASEDAVKRRSDGG